MTDRTVVVTDHDFEDLSIEREILNDTATIRDHTREVGSTEADRETLSEADAVLNLRAPLGAGRIASLADCRVTSVFS
jgi:hypothetical protein